MSTAAEAAPIQLDSSQSVSNPATTDINPLEVRWGFQVALRDKPLDARECGISKAPFGRFWPIKSFQAPRENHTTDEYKPREQPELITAEYCENFIMEALGGRGAQNRTNWGMVAGFNGELDAAKMAVISQTILPKLSVIRSIAADMGTVAISDVCDGSDDLDFGEREECITCWYKWLKSPVIDSYMQRVALEGRVVHTRDKATGEITESTVRPTIGDLRKAKELVLVSFAQGTKQLEDQWKMIVSEVDRVNGRQVSDYEHFYRKDLHKGQPEDRQLAITREAFKGVNAAHSGSDPRVDALVDLTIQNTQLLQEMARSRTGIQAPQQAPVIPPVEAPAEDPSVQIVTEEGGKPIEFSATAPETAADPADLAPGAKLMNDKKKNKEK